MTQLYNQQQLREIFHSSFNLESYTDLLRNLFSASRLRTTPEKISNSDDPEQGYYLGEIDTNDSYNIGLFYYKIGKGSVANKRVGLRNLVKQFINPTWGKFDAAIVVFDDKKEWRLSFICDIKDVVTSPKRYTFVFGDRSNYYKTPVDRFIKLQQSEISFENIKNAFSVEALSKDFYTKLYKWYTWAMSNDINVTFPENPETVKDDRNNLNVKLIRLITRLLFVWFIKQKKLVPDNIFDINYLKSILVNFDENSLTDGNYYNAILQNLFFATLNCAIIDDEGNQRRFASSKSGRDTRNLYRYKEMFRLSEQEILDLFGRVPFLNGGLFECLDKPKDLYLHQEYDIFYDGFSRNAAKAGNGNYKYRAFVPNILFFNDDEEHPGLINLFSQYNFTIEENSSNDAVISLDPELLGRVFENLLAVYNPETQESARKSTGSFYTPRPIVDFMVDEAIKSYLIGKNIFGVDETSLNLLFTERVVCSDWTSSIKQAICEALRNIKILDPACGSGAFPMGCLLRIVDLTELLCDNKVNRYQLKLDIIENCIYGVDIQPIAMLICKLRFFISLICDQQNIDFNNPETNFGINTLPNLETKFVAANTLLSPNIRQFDNAWNDDELDRMKMELLEIRNSHFLSKSRSAKKKLERQDDALRQKMIEYIVAISSANFDVEKVTAKENLIKQLLQELEPYKKEVWVDQTKPVENTLFGPVESPESIFRVDINKQKRDEITSRIKLAKADLEKEKNKGVIKGFDAAVKQITEWNPYDQNFVASFFDPEWMFGVSDGFDVVVGNPPYISLTYNEGELSKMYVNSGFSTFKGTGDIYCLFYERGYQLLKNNGHLCYITSNKWMRAGYGDKTRNFFAMNTNPVLLIDFAGVKIFESATVDTNILLYSKGKNLKTTVCAVANKQNKDIILNNLSLFVQQNSSVCEFSNSDSWVILSPIELSIKRKIEAVGTPLKDWDIQINYGIKTGYNEAFIISTEKRNEILANCQTEDERTRTAELIRPILRGRDIKRYGYDWAGLWLIATFPSRHYDIEQYPAVKNYLLEFGIERLEQTGKTHIVNGAKIKARKKTNNKWFETQDSIAYWEDFSKPKILYSEIVKSPQFYLDNDNVFYPEATTFLLVGEHLEYLYKLVNSKIVTFFFKKFYAGGGLGEKGYRYKKVFFEKLPIPKWLGNEIQKTIIESSDDHNIELSIKQLFELTTEQVNFIESE